MKNYYLGIFGITDITRSIQMQQWEAYSAFLYALFNDGLVMKLTRNDMTTPLKRRKSKKLAWSHIIHQGIDAEKKMGKLY